MGTGCCPEEEDSEPEYDKRIMEILNFSNKHTDAEVAEE